MQFLCVFAAVVAMASAGVYHPIPLSALVRAPAYDSAVIKSDRLGGNFAYSTIESHAYAHHTPIIQHVATPIAVSYSAPAFYNPAAFLPQPAFFAPHHIQAVAAAPVAPEVVADAPKAEEEIVAPAAPVEEAIPTDAAPAEEAAAPIESTAAPAEAAAPAEPASDDTVAVEAA